MLFVLLYFINVNLVPSKINIFLSEYEIDSATIYKVKPQYTLCMCTRYVYLLANQNVLFCLVNCFLKLRKIVLILIFPFFTKMNLICMQNLIGNNYIFIICGTYPK